MRKQKTAVRVLLANRDLGKIKLKRPRVGEIRWVLRSEMMEMVSMAVQNKNVIT